MRSCQSARRSSSLAFTAGRWNRQRERSRHLAAGSTHLENSTGLDTRKLLMWLFLGSECLFFGSFIAAYILYRGHSTVGPYPEDLVDIPFTSVSAFVLLMSSVS